MILHIKATLYMKCSASVLFLSLFFLAGCGSNSLQGIVFAHIRIPLTKNLDNTSVTSIHAGEMIIKIKEPVSDYGFYAKLKSNAIGDIAKRNGFEKVYFADLEIFNILGIWTSQKVHIYGEIGCER